MPYIATQWGTRAMWFLVCYYAGASARRPGKYTALHEGGSDYLFLDAQTRDVGGLLVSPYSFPSNIKTIK
jgi:hypothetical protein